MFDVIIIGAGGFGREVYNWIKEISPSNSYKIKGFLDDNPHQFDGYTLDAGIISNIDDYKICKNDRFIMAIGNIDDKKKVVGALRDKGAEFISMIHPTAVIAQNVEIGQGVVICPFVTISDSATIGDFVMMHIYSSCGHDSEIGGYSILSPYSTVNGFSRLEDEVFMGTHSTVTASRKVGFRAKISANSVAMGDVPKYGFVYGVPGKVRVIFSGVNR